MLNAIKHLVKRGENNPGIAKTLHTPGLKGFAPEKHLFTGKEQKREQPEIKQAMNFIKSGLSSEDIHLVTEIKDLIKKACPGLKLSAEELDREIKLMVAFNKLYPTGHAKMFANADLPLTFKKIGDNHYIIHLKTRNNQEIVGIGQFKIVFHALEIHLTEKRVRGLTHGKAKDVAASKEMEEEILKQFDLKHKSIVPVIAHSKIGDSFSFYSTYCQSDLKKYLALPEVKKIHSAESWNDDDFNDRIAIVNHVASGLNHLHKNGLCHNDLKLDNVLLDEGRWKLNDLGLTGKDGSPVKSVCVLHIAPEQQEQINKNQPVTGTKKTDVFAFGILMYEVFGSYFPRQDKKPNLDSKFLFAHWPTDDVRVEKLKALISLCISKDPAQRPTITGARQRLKELLGEVNTPLARFASNNQPQESQDEYIFAPITQDAGFDYLVTQDWPEFTHFSPNDYIYSTV